MPDIPRNAAQQKSQTPIITAFGFECPGLSGPSVAAEGLELRLIFKGKTYQLSLGGESLGIFFQRGSRVFASFTGNVSCESLYSTLPVLACGSNYLPDGQTEILKLKPLHCKEIRSLEFMQMLKFWE